MVMAMLPLAAAVHAADYPDKPVEYIIPFGPGGESDITARFQQPYFTDKFKQTLVISYKPGGGGAVAWAQLNTMPGDGYTIMGVNLPHIIVKPIVRTVGDVVLNTTLETIEATLDSPQGKRAVQAVAGSVLDAVFYGPALTEIESLTREISLQVISHMKDVVVVKKWSLPDDQDRRPPMPWEMESASEGEVDAEETPK